MASQNIARLGVVLGIDTAAWQKDIDEAISAQRKLTREIKRENTAAEKEIERLTYAVKDYGREVTMVEKIQREFLAGGKFERATTLHKQMLYEQAKAYDELAMASKRANTEMVKGASVGMLGAREGMAKLTQQQVAALSYQTTDIVTGLVSGQNPLIILIQQGGQLRDQFGGFKPLFEAIKSVFTATRVAAVGLAAVLGTLAFAAFKGREEFERLRDDLILTNNYAGITISTFNSLYATLSKVSNISMGGAKDIFSQLVASGKFTQESMFAVGEAIARVAKLSGESADQVAKNLIPNFDGSAGAAKRLNEQYRFLTVEQYKQIELLNLQGKTQEAARVTAEALTASLKNQTREVGLLESTYSIAKNAVSSFWDYLLNIGKQDTTKDTVENLRKAMLDAADALQKNMSPLAKQRAQELFNNTLKAYQDASKRLEAEQDANNQRSLEKTKEQVALENYEKAGGLAKYRSLVAENDKIILETQFEQRVKGLDQFQRLELEYAKRIQDYVTEQLKLNEEERGVFQQQRLKNIADKSIQEWARAEQAKAEISRQESIMVRDRQSTERLSIEQEKQKQDLFKQNILISQTDLRLAESKLKTQEEIARIMRNTKLDDAAKQELVLQQEELGKAREEVIKYGQQFDILKSSGTAVFSSMNSAIDTFVENGKLSFSSFAESVIKDLIKIQLKAQATQLLSAGGGFLGGIFNLGVRSFSESSSSFVGPPTSLMTYADGGMPPVGVPSLVGENGPELFVPRTAGTIIPNQQMNSYMGNQPQIVYNGPYIANMSAIDTQSATQFLAKNKNAVWSANQSASRGMPTSR
jgi:phage-related minor tail protein